MPRPVVALPWGSRSTTRTRNPSSARPAPRLTAVVVLPTPPFWLATAMIRGVGPGHIVSPFDHALLRPQAHRVPGGEIRRGGFQIGPRIREILPLSLLGGRLVVRRLAGRNLLDHRRLRVHCRLRWDLLVYWTLRTCLGGPLALVRALISTSDADAHRQLFRRFGFTGPILPIPTLWVKPCRALSSVCFT